jgi:hypothetical protein
MAKKKEKIVDLKPKADKISNEQLKKVQETINTMNRFQLEIGSIETKKHELVHNIAGLKDSLKVMQDELQKEYGTFDINISDGTINYPKENGETNS